MQQREEKQLDSALETIIQRVNDLKQSLASMILKVENEYDTMNWPSFLDNYALISGQVSNFKICYTHTHIINYVLANFSFESTKS